LKTPSATVNLSVLLFLMYILPQEQETWQTTMISLHL